MCSSSCRVLETARRASRTNVTAPIKRAIAPNNPKPTGTHDIIPFIEAESPTVTLEATKQADAEVQGDDGSLEASKAYR